jgi:hypothetical protein
VRTMNQGNIQLWQTPIKMVAMHRRYLLTKMDKIRDYVSKSDTFHSVTVKHRIINDTKLSCEIASVVPDYRPRSPGLFPALLNFLRKWVWNGVHWSSLSTTEEIL